MKTQAIKYFGLIIILSGLLHSCETILEFDESLQKPLIVLNSFIHPNDVFTVQLAQSNSILSNSNDFSPLFGRSIKVYEEGHLIKTLTHRSDGNYFEEGFYPVVGKSYKVEVYDGDLLEVWAETSIPKPVEIFEISTATSAKRQGDESMIIDLKFNDPAKIANYYGVSIHENTLYRNESDNTQQEECQLKSIDISSSKILNGMETNEQDSVDKFNWESTYYLFDDRIYNGEETSIKLVVEAYSQEVVQSLLTVLLNSVSEDYYLHLNSKANFAKASINPFAEPVQVYSNVVNGIGIFAGSASSKENITYTKEE